MRAKVWDRTPSTTAPKSRNSGIFRRSVGEERSPLAEASKVSTSLDIPLRILRMHHRNARDPPAKTNAKRTRSILTRMSRTIRKGAGNGK